MKTLQEQYNLLTEGKGNADVFLKSARRLFPELITPVTNVKDATDILKQRQVIAENFIGFQPITQIESAQPNFEKAFKSFLSEEVKAVEKKTSKEVEETQDSAFDYTDDKNIDNVFGEQFLKGYYAEMKDPKNADKSMEDLKEMVAKNLAKDRSYYVKNAAFGVKGLGYEEMPSSKTDQMEKAPLQEVRKKKPSVETTLSQIEKEGKTITLEAQIQAVDELIKSKQQRLEIISEDEDLEDLIDKKKIKELTKEIKLLEKRKSKMEKMYEKMCGKAYQQQEVIDEDEDYTSEDLTSEVE